MMRRGYLPILLVLAVLAGLPLLVSSNVVLNFVVFVLIITVAAQGWNLLGGVGGQSSFGHAAFFGTGAYVSAILQVRFGINAWVSTRGVHKSEHRQAEFLGRFHQTQSLAVAFRLGHAKVAQTTLFGVTALLVT